MGYTYSGDSVLGVSLKVDAPKPLDIRCVVNTIDDLYTLPEKSSYLGMSVSVISEKTIYMLIDKEQIGNENGWEPVGKSTVVPEEPSDEPIEEPSEETNIETCTLEEYEAWKENTNVDYTPIDESLPYLKEDTYYYIYENESDQQYLSASWGKQMEETVSGKASNESVININQTLEKIQTDVDNINTNISTNYVTNEQVAETYTTKEQVAEQFGTVYTKEESDSLFQTIENANATYSTKEELETLSTTITENFVTKEDLKGSDTEDEDFIFVTQTQYNKDRDAQAVELTTGNLIADSTTISEVNIQKIEEKEVEQNDPETGETTTITESEVTSSVKLTTESNRLMAGSEQLAFTSEVPKIEYLSTEEYTTKVENSELDSETYYYTYDATDNPENGYVTNSQLTEQYYTKQQVNQLIAEEIQKLVARIEILEAYHTVQEETPEDSTDEEVTTE